MREFVYRVTTEKSLSEIAEKFASTTELLRRRNGCDDVLFCGMRLIVPAVKGTYYTVKPFDTCESVARKFGVGADRIREFNAVSEVFLGERIFIPLELR